MLGWPVLAAALPLGFLAGCDEPGAPMEEPESPIEKLIVIAGTDDGRILQVDAASGVVRGVGLGLPPAGCGATADVSRREVYVARGSHGAPFSLYRIDGDAGRVLYERPSAELAVAAGLEDIAPSPAFCPMTLADGRLYMVLDGTRGAYAIAAIDAQSLEFITLLAPPPYDPYAMEVTGPLPYAPMGALLVQGFAVDPDGRPIRGSLRVVGYDLGTGAALPQLDLRFDAPYGATPLALDPDAPYAYINAYPSLLLLDLEKPDMVSAGATPAAGPLALARGLVYHAGVGLSVERPGPGKVYVYDRAGALTDSIDIWPADEMWPPFVNELTPDAAGERLYIHAGTGEGGLYYDLQRARVLVVDLDQRTLVGEIPLEVWPAGSMLVLF